MQTSRRAGWAFSPSRDAACRHRFEQNFASASRPSGIGPEHRTHRS